MNLSQVGKILMVTGGIVVLAGVIVFLAGKTRLLGKLPGDILIHRGNFTFYFPWVTFLVLSVLLTILVNVAIRLLR